MKQFKNRIWFILLVVLTTCGSLKASAQAANKSDITRIKANTMTKVQLDGKGAKEKVQLVVNNKKNEDNSYTSMVVLTIDEEKVFEKDYKLEEGKKPKVELIVTDIKMNDKYKDLFLAVYDSEWYGTYRELIRVTYKNSKASIDHLLETLRSIKSPKMNNKFYDTSGRGYMLNPIESCKGLTKGDLVVDGNGTVKWHVCLYTGTADYFHGYISLKLKSDELKAGNYPSGTIVLTGFSGKLRKSIVFYKSAGSSKSVIAVAAGKEIKLTEFKYIRKKLYVKAQYGKNSGWISQSALKALEKDGTLHA